MRALKLSSMEAPMIAGFPKIELACGCGGKSHKSHKSHKSRKKSHKSRRNS
jgi:hypothetical protein